MWLQRFFHAPSQSWQAKAERKRDETMNKIPLDWRVSEAKLSEAKQQQNITGRFIANMLTEREAEITAWSAVEIASEIAERRCKAVEVATAFCHRAALAHQINNCLHEIFFDAALEQARQLDEYQQEFNRLKGPLHGVPVSLKDQFHVSEVETTMGYVGWIDTFQGERHSSKYKAQESLIVQHLLAAGVVLYCKTSLPQTLLLGETHNNIIGTTSNPINQKLSCGGSSGGEGALQALGGSCLGVGTDIGGSVRIPAAFCGIYAIKPSHDRFSYKDMANSNPGQTVIKSSVGFMATSLLSLKLIQTALLSARPWVTDSEVVPLPWRPQEEILPPKLSFGLLFDDGYCNLHPPVLRGLKMVEAALLKAGHEVVCWCPPSHRRGSSLHNRFMQCDGGTDVWKQLRLSREPVIAQLRDVYGAGPTAPISLLDFQRLVLEREAYRQEYNAYWNSTVALTQTGRPVDAIVMPIAPHAAVVPGQYFHYDYSDIVNLLDNTSVAVPVTNADQVIDLVDLTYQPVNDTDRSNWASYDASIYHGAPVGVQIVARRLQEERCLALAQQVEVALSMYKLDSAASEGSLHGLLHNELPGQS